MTISFNHSRPGGERVRAQVREVQQTRIRADPSMITTLMDMGLTRSQCKAALKNLKLDIEQIEQSAEQDGQENIMQWKDGFNR